MTTPDALCILRASSVDELTTGHVVRYDGDTGDDSDRDECDEAADFCEVEIIEDEDGNWIIA